MFNKPTRRELLKQAGALAAGLALGVGSGPALTAAMLDTAKASAASRVTPLPRHPNLLFILADQWRAQATGYGGDPNVRTPHLDRLAAESVNFRTAVSNVSVCCPYRANLMTSRNPLEHGVFVNDVHLKHETPSFADALNDAGYETGYIGKWHLDGHGRSSFVPPERRQGFKFWKGWECSHDYLHGRYYEAGDPTPKNWAGYEPEAQTVAALDYLRDCGDRPFALFLSWGPPHNPYETAPERLKALYPGGRIELRPNVPAAAPEWVRPDLTGYYAHIAALDEQVGRLLHFLDERGLAGDTIVVFTADHGDMLGSQGRRFKQVPWDESILVPLLVRAPRWLGVEPHAVDFPIGTYDLMPTLLGLMNAPIPAAAEGMDVSPVLRGRKGHVLEAQLIACYQPFGNYNKQSGGKEYRGVRTRRHTYARTLDGPWILYDNLVDPCQMTNLVDDPKAAPLREALDALLVRLLKERHDDFRPGMEYMAKWGYPIDATGTVPYTN